MSDELGVAMRMLVSLEAQRDSLQHDLAEAEEEAEAYDAALRRLNDRVRLLEAAIRLWLEENDEADRTNCPLPECPTCKLRAAYYAGAPK